jgi:hypothetical protein
MRWRCCHTLAIVNWDTEPLDGLARNCSDGGPILLGLRLPIVRPPRERMHRGPAQRREAMCAHAHQDRFARERQDYAASLLKRMREQLGHL